MGLEFKVLSWDDIIAMSLRLGEKIKSSGFEPDVLIGIARGGLVPLRILSDYFNNGEILIFNVKLYKDIGTSGEEVRFVQKVEHKLNGKKILVVDDVADKGITLKTVVDYITNILSPDEVKVATLHYKPWSVFKPDYYIEEVKEWIVYPWEYVETLASLEKMVGDPREDRVKITNVINEIKNLLKKYNGFSINSD